MDKELMEHVWLAVIAGGKGTRLFPISHEGRPKQFCNLNSSQTFIQATIKRFLDLGVRPTQVVVITANSKQTEHAREQTRGMGILDTNICEVDEEWGYPVVMVKAAEIIREYDDKAIIVNTPSDQYIEEQEEGFKQAFYGALDVARDNGKVAIIGVKITDLTTAIGCGHVVFNPDESEGSGFHEMTDFVEKPDKKRAESLMRSSSSVCNTGINIWKADTLLDVITAKKILDNHDAAKKEGQKWELSTDQFLKMFPEVQATAGLFDWYDCGTLKALYEISEKTPHHKNASIGKGTVERTDCRNSLFYAVKGFRLHATGFRNVSVMTNVVEINGENMPIVCITELEKSQQVKELAENISVSHKIFGDDFQIAARNNIIMRSNISDKVVFGFVGVENCIVNVYKNSDDTFDVFASQQAVAAPRV